MVDESLLQIETCLLDRRKVHLGVAPDGRVYLRVTSFWPKEAAQHWHGPYSDRQAAETDFRTRTQRPRVTRAQIAEASRRGEHGTVEGVPMIVLKHRWTGHLTLTAYQLVDEAGQESKRPRIARLTAAYASMPVIDQQRSAARKQASSNAMIIVPIHPEAIR